MEEHTAPVRANPRAKKRRILAVEMQTDERSMHASLECDELKEEAGYEAGRGNFFAAVELYSGALQRSPNNYDILICRSKSYYKMAKYQEALDDADKARFYPHFLGLLASFSNPWRFCLSCVLLSKTLRYIYNIILIPSVSGFIDSEHSGRTIYSRRRPSRSQATSRRQGQLPSCSQIEASRLRYCRYIFCLISNFPRFSTTPILHMSLG